MKFSSACRALAALLILAVSAPSARAQASDSIDVQVLNFALNLEYLEANFYSCAAYGEPISQDLWGEGGEAPIGCEKAVFSEKATWYLAHEIAQDEIAHVAFLRSVLGNQSVPQPKIDIGPAFTVAANAAVGLHLNMSVTLQPDFNPYANDVFFLHGSFIFEDVGATAYAGAAALIENKDYLTAAAQILSVESYHAGAVRYALYKQQNKWAPFKEPELLRVRTVVQSISDLRDAVDGSSDDDQGVATRDGGKKYACNIVPADANGLIYTRNTDQVLSIVYLGGTSSGGFFPNGLNGAIKTVSTARR